MQVNDDKPYDDINITPMLDLAYAYGWWTTSRSNYDPTSVVAEDVVAQNFLLSFSFRF